MAKKVNIVIDQSSTFNKDIPYLDTSNNLFDFTGYTGEGRLRKHHLSSNSANLTVVLSEGNINISMTDEETSVLEEGKYVYNVRITDESNNVTRAIEGLIFVSPNI